MIVSSLIYAICFLRLLNLSLKIPAFCALGIKLILYPAIIFLCMVIYLIIGILKERKGSFKDCNDSNGCITDKNISRKKYTLIGFWLSVVTMLVPGCPDTIDPNYESGKCTYATLVFDNNLSDIAFENELFWICVGLSFFTVFYICYNCFIMNKKTPFKLIMTSAMLFIIWVCRFRFETRGTDYVYRYNSLELLIAAIYIGLVVYSVIGIVLEKKGLFREQIIARQEAAEAEKRAEEQRIKDEEAAEAKRRQEEDDRVLKFYNACNDRNIKYDPNDSECCKNLMLIAPTMGIHDLEEAKKTYEKGASVLVRRAYDKEVKLYHKALDCSQYLPKDKYDCIPERLLHRISYLDGMIVRTQISKNLNSTTLRHVDKSSTASFVAGSVVGGPLLGAVAGVKTELDNAQGRINEQIARNESAERAKQNSKDLSQYESERRNLNSKLSKIERILNELVVDESEPMEKFKLLSFSDWNFEITNGRNIKANAHITIDQSKVQLFDKPTIIDGSLKLEVKDSAGNVVANGCYTQDSDVGLRGFRENGFPRSLSVVCIVDENYHVDENEAFTCSVTPINMWFAEKISDRDYESVTK